ncbi:MAG: TolC family protein [Gemmatimonadales bacterium]|nr:TolC family protein [Gemmatimonadales bacterium]
MPRPPHLRLALLLLGAPTSCLAAQTLTLAEALARADRSAWANEVARATLVERRADAVQPRRGILPGVRTELGWVRTTDPLTAFGLLLRQRGVTPAAFDPAALNDPAARSNWGAAVVADVPLVNADAWAGRVAARAGVQAEVAVGEATREAVRLVVVRAYWGAVLAEAAVRTLARADTAAQARVRAIEAMLRDGVVTRADLLLASVRAGEVAQQFVAARAGARQARRQLALALGAPADTLLELPVALPAPDTLAPSGTDTSRPTATLRAAEAGADAARADARRLGAALLPRVNGFGRLDWNAAGTPFGGRSAWTVGVQASWSPWSGGAELAAAQAGVARRDAAEARARQAAAEAAVDRARAEDALGVARARLALAERAVGQASEAHRIVARKYEGGLATVSELLEAQALETSMVLGRAAARYEGLVAVAEWRRALGLGVEAVPLAPGTE